MGVRTRRLHHCPPPPIAQRRMFYDSFYMRSMCADSGIAGYKPGRQSSRSTGCRFLVLLCVRRIVTIIVTIIVAVVVVVTVASQERSFSMFAHMTNVQRTIAERQTARMTFVFAR
jgi:hypothetical protein